jgi:hypothetical protein
MMITFISGWRSVNDSSNDNPSAAPSLISSNATSKVRCWTRSKDSSALGVVSMSKPLSVKNHLSRVRKFSSSSTTRTERRWPCLRTSSGCLAGEVSAVSCAGAALILSRSAGLPFAMFFRDPRYRLTSIPPTRLGGRQSSRRGPGYFSLLLLLDSNCILSPLRIR